jgi:GNAT superfamily N-acetyltransferase
MHVREVDIADETALRPLWECGWAANTPGRPWHTYRTWELQRQVWQSPPSTMRLRLFGAYDDAGSALGYGELALPLKDNLHLAEMSVAVDPAAGRRGAGTLLVERLIAAGRDAGRTSSWTEVHAPLDADSAGLAFAGAHGFSVAQSDEMKVGDLPAIAAREDEVVTATAAAAAGYRVVRWAQECPEELLEPYCVLASAFMALIPLGDLDMEPEIWDADRVRERERRQIKMGRFECTTMVLAPDGTGAGYTELLNHRSRPELASQGATVVLPAHRGHRLGLLLKVTNAAAMMAARPDCRHVLTGNAAENVHMNAINDALDFRVVERSLEMQRPL